MEERKVSTVSRVGEPGLAARVVGLPWVRWSPGRDTFVALATLIYFVPSYYLGANTGSLFSLVNFLFATTVVLVILPSYYVLRVMERPPSEIGFTTRNLLPSLGLSALLVLRYSPALRAALGSVPEANVLPHLLYCGLCLWEPFFIHCWIQLRFEEAFGIIPGILAAGVCTAAYHVGTFPVWMVLKLGGFGLFYGVLFRLTRNIFTLWPLAWAGAAAMGTVAGGFVFGWSHAVLYGGVLVVQLVSIWVFTRSGRQGLGNAYEADAVNVKTRGSMELQDWMRACVYVPLMFYQFYLSWRFYNGMGLDWATNLGWLVLTVSAVFGWLPVYEFKRRGGVPGGESYMQTTRLVTSGVYSVVRHPQFLAGILITVSMMLMSQHVHSVVAGLVAAVVYASEVQPADERLVEKFGEPYLRYKERVPALNFVVGVVRLIRRGGPLRF
jgi:protein-S-isoprenylcysteine O-methyltransferase Ste14